MRRLPRGRRKSFGRKGLAATLAAFALFLAWPRVQAGQPASPGRVFHIDVHGLALLLESDPNLLLVDVRTSEERTGPLGGIPQSRNVPLREIEKNPEQFPRDKTLVLICSSGYRSSKAADLLAEHGYIAYSVDGGMEAWRAAHSPAPATQDPRPRDHGAPTPNRETEKPKPPENEEQRAPDKDVLDSNMGC